LPVDEGTAAGYRRVRDSALALHASLVAALDAGPAVEVAFALRALQVRLDPLREVLERRCWDLAERRHVPTGRQTLAPPRAREWRYFGRPMNDMMEAQLDIHEFFDRLQAESTLMRGVESELVRWQLELSLLARRADSLARHGIDRVRVEIVPLQASDAALVRIAWADYAALLSQLDAHELPSTAPGVRRFEGAGLADAFAGECGVHFWYRGNDRPVPLAVRVLPLDGDAVAALPTEVVRIRYEPAKEGEHRRLTDLRSGQVRKFTEPLSEDDWRLLLWNAAAATTQPER
jgi:ATP-dependent Clp protease ATP-binding subunit ClpC